MGYIVVNNFKAGLDHRRDQMSSVPGVLKVAENGHINQGGEFEKRKAFTRIALPANTFGLEALADSLVVFGITAGMGGLPAGVTYQQVTHEINPTTAIASVVHSTSFAGAAFVIVTYVDGKTYCFYGADNPSIRVKDQYVGIVSDAVSPNIQVGLQIADAIFFSGLYTSIGSDIYSLPGASYSLSIAATTALGTLTEQRVSAPIPGTPAQVAVGTFRIFAGSEAGGNQITQIAVGVDNLLGAPVPFNDSIEQTASDVVTAINAGASIYHATTEAGKITIFADASGATPNGKDVVVTAAGNVCIGNFIFSLFGTAFKLDYIKVNGVNVLSAALDYPQSVGQTVSAFCTAVVANINAGTGGHGYLAFTASNIILISKAVTSSADVSLAVEISVTPAVGGSGVVVIGTMEPLLLSIDRTIVVFSPTTIPAGGGKAWISESVKVYATGGTPPYKYEWPVIIEGDTGGSLYTTNPTAASTQFSVYKSKFGSNITGTFQVTCKVIDALGKVGVSPPVQMTIPQ